MNHFSFPRVRSPLYLPLLAALLVLIWMLSTPNLIQAQEEPSPTPEPPPTAQPGYPVEVGGQVLFYVTERIGSIPAEERAAIIAQRINDLANNPFAPPLEISLVESEFGTDILAGDEILATVTDRDAASVSMTREEAAQTAATLIEQAITTTREQNKSVARLSQAVEILLILAVAMFLIWLINHLYHRLVKKIDEAPRRERPLFGKGGITQVEATRRFLKSFLNIIRWTIIILLLIYVLPNVLKIFPTTADFASRLLELVSIPFARLWSWFYTHQNSLITITVIIVLTYLLIRLIRFFFNIVGRGEIRIKGFEADWAPFTARIISFLLIVGAVVVAFPYIPGSDSPAFRAITVFLGALFTLSSTAAVTNIVAGVIQTYTGAFKVGDVIRIGEVTGIVTEKRLITTKVRTFKNEEVYIPNGAVLSTNVTNFTKMARGKGLIIYSTVTIGYDAPWKKVHELLIAAAEATPDVDTDPHPFVLQTSLNDYNVSYQINCYIHRPERMMRIYSALHANIQDQFNRAGVEIMSPAFMGVRDANTIAIPEENRPPDYQVPRFLIDKS